MIIGVMCKTDIAILEDSANVYIDGQCHICTVLLTYEKFGISAVYVDANGNKLYQEQRFYSGCRIEREAHPDKTLDGTYSAADNLAIWADEINAEAVSAVAPFIGLA